MKTYMNLIIKTDNELALTAADPENNYEQMLIYLVVDHIGKTVRVRARSHKTDYDSCVEEHMLSSIIDASKLCQYGDEIIIPALNEGADYVEIDTILANAPEHDLIGLIQNPDEYFETNPVLEWYKKCGWSYDDIIDELDDQAIESGIVFPFERDSIKEFVIGVLKNEIGN